VVEAKKQSLQVGPKPLPPLPIPQLEKDITLNISILTVSDRAYNKEYESGDLSGPAVKASFSENFNSYYKPSNSGSDSRVGGRFNLTFDKSGIVPDEVETISNNLADWCDSNNNNSGNSLNLILTTGGTGFSKRDVTPEATSKILTSNCPQLITSVLSAVSKTTNNPLVLLSRGTSGVRGNTLIVNLPGNPTGVGEVIGGGLVPLVLYWAKEQGRG